MRQIKFQIRPSTPEDLEKILEIQAIALRKLSFSYNSTQIESLVRSQAICRTAQDEVGVVAESETEIIGFAALSAFLAQEPQVAGVYVHPSFTHQGIGAKLLKTLEKIALDRGDKAMHVMSSWDTVNFYQKCGYQFIRASGFYSEEKIWIQCKNLEKKLIVPSAMKPWHSHLISWMRKVIYALLLQVAKILVAWLVLLAAFLLIISLLR